MKKNLVPTTTGTFSLDFEKIPVLAQSFRKEPTLKVEELKNATGEADLTKHRIVNLYGRFSQGNLCLPLEDRSVRDWLKTVEFKSEPQVLYGTATVNCGKEVKRV